MRKGLVLTEAAKPDGVEQDPLRTPDLLQTFQPNFLRSVEIEMGVVARPSLSKSMIPVPMGSWPIPRSTAAAASLPQPSRTNYMRRVGLVWADTAPFRNPSIYQYFKGISGGGEGPEIQPSPPEVIVFKRRLCRHLPAVKYASSRPLLSGAHVLLPHRSVGRSPVRP
jgi:hypothetical protein